MVKCRPTDRLNPPSRIATWEDDLIVTTLNTHALMWKSNGPALPAAWRAFMRDVRREARRRGLLG